MGGSGISPRLTVALLALLVAYLAAMDMRAILQDNRLMPTDTLLEESGMVEEAPAEFDKFVEWLPNLFAFRKGPLGPALCALLQSLVGNPLLAQRLVTLLVHWACIVVLFILGRRLGGRPEAGLFAALIYGTFPGAFGWARIGTADPLPTLPLLICLGLMMRRRLSKRGAALLGVVAGLATLARTAFPLFAGAPALLFTGDQLRRPGQRLVPPLAALSALATAGWWLLPAAGTMAEYASMSTGVRRGGATLGDQLNTYLFDIPGSLALYAAALGGGILIWILRPERRYDLYLLGLALVVPLAALIFLFDPSARYAVPLFSVAALLAGSGVGQAGRVSWAPRRVKVALGVVLALALLLVHWQLNMDGVTPHPAGRENGAGMVTPDTRPYDALEQVARFTHETGMGIFPLWDPLIYAPCPHHGLRVLGARGIDLLMEPDPDAAQADFLAGGRPLFVLVCHQDEDPLKALARGMGVNLNPLSRKLVAPVLARHKEVLFTAADPYANQFLGDIEYSVVRIDPR